MVSLAVAAALALAPSGHVAFVHGGRLVELDLATGKQQIVALHATRPVAWSGDGKLLSYAGHVVGEIGRAHV